MHTYVGEVTENLSMSLGFSLGGRVEKIHVQAGDRVRAGQLLASVDKTSARNAYQSAKATLDQAEDAYNRLKKVYEQGSLAEVKWVEMQTNLDKARAMEQIAKRQLDECELHAPVAGVVERAHVQAGASVLPGAPVVTLLDVHTLSVSFSVPEEDISAVQVGDMLSVKVPALDNVTVKAKVTECGVSASRMAHTYSVKAAFVNPPAPLLPGMVSKVQFNRADDDVSGIVVPAKSVQTHPEGQCVWVLRNGKAQRIIIHSAKFIANGVLVMDGLRPGDTVVTAGIQKLYPDAIVTIQNMEK